MDTATDDQQDYLLRLEKGSGCQDVINTCGSLIKFSKKFASLISEYSTFHTMVSYIPLQNLQSILIHFQTFKPAADCAIYQTLLHQFSSKKDVFQIVKKKKQKTKGIYGKENYEQKLQMQVFCKYDNNLIFEMFKRITFTQKQRNSSRL